MQFLSRLSGDVPRFDREASAGGQLPYAAHVAPDILQLRDGSLMQVIRLEGLQFETVDSDEISYRKQLRDAMLRSVGTSRVAIYHHIIRRSFDLEPEGEFSDGFSRALNDAWQARLTAKKLYVNQLYLSIIRGPVQGRTGLASGMASKLGQVGRAEKAAHFATEVRSLRATSEQVLAALEIYAPQLLGVQDKAGAPHSDLLAFLAELYNGVAGPILLPHGDAGEYLPRRRISFGQASFELSPQGDHGRLLGAMVSIKDYPGQTVPGMLDELLRIPARIVITQSFGFINKQVGLGRINLSLRRMRASDDEALSLRSELAQAKDDLAAGRAAFGEHHMTVMLYGETPELLDEAVAETHAALADLGIVAVREDVGLEPAFWAQFPGNFKYITRRALIGSANFASLASGHNFPIGKARGNHWGGALTVLETTAAGPYHFNFHHGDLGNFTIIGPSGSGKTVVLNFLLAQARKYRPRIMFFDKDRGAELFIRAIDGVYDILRPGVASQLNPLQLPDTAENRAFLIDWIGQLVRASGDLLGPAELLQVKEAVDANFLAPPTYRRLSSFVELLRGGHRPHPQDLYARMRPWWGEGEHAWLFDNARDGVDMSREALGFDMTRILNSSALRTPAMMYLFHRVEERLDGTPSIIVIDEGWKALDDDVFVARIKDWEKTIRKRNGIVGFATQSAEDALNSRIAGAIVEQAATQIFMANPKAQARDYMDGFGLSRHEYDLVRTLPDMSRCFLVKHGHDSVVVRLNLNGEKDLLTVLSGQERTVRLLDEIRAGTGDDPARWLPALLAKA